MFVHKVKVLRLTALKIRFFLFYSINDKALSLPAGSVSFDSRPIESICCCQDFFICSIGVNLQLSYRLM